MRINLDAKINKYVTAKLGIAAREEYRFQPNGGATGDIFRMLMRGKQQHKIAIWLTDYQVLILRTDKILHLSQPINRLHS